MFLKRLDVVGFKSFAERTSVDFVPGVTAVVGPNGSGKSNVIDSIRWVLGEQSAKSLRGAKMEDVIFAGSDSRKALNFAEVTLTLDNEDQTLPIEYNEVSVTRRVFRSGDSEYLLNHQPCRLKDIVDLFMDSGLGRESFSIISQGKVDQILNSKPEERRAIFEDAAGVLKYKNRKKKAELKLAETQDNLLRVQDILFELEGQIEPLRMQSSIAKDYLAQKEELEQYDVAVLVHDINELQETHKRVTNDLNNWKKQELELATTLAKSEAHLVEKRDHVAALDDSIDELQALLLQTSEELEKLDGQKQVLAERQKNTSQNETQIKEALEEVTYKITQSNIQRENAEKLVHVADEEMKSLKERVKELEGKLKTLENGVEDQIESLKADYIDYLNQQASAKNELTYLTRQLEQLQSRSSRVELDNQKDLDARSALQAKQQEAIEQVTVSKGNLSAHITAFREEQQKLESLERTVDKEEKQLYEAYGYVQKIRSRKEALSEMEEEFQGFFHGVREVLKARKEVLAGVEGAVAELIQVDKSMELAIETALGSATQHIVVQNEQHARQAIQFLKQRKLGRATFLPLSVMKPRVIGSAFVQSLSSHESYIGIASSLVKTQGEYQVIVDNLLGSTIIARDLKGANELAKIVGHRFRVVTLEGDVVNPGGSMTGGMVKQNATSLLTRKNELEELSAKLIEMEEKTKGLEELYRRHKEEYQLGMQSLKELQTKGEELRIKEQSAVNNLQQIELEVTTLNRRLQSFDIEKSEWLEEQSSIKRRQEELSQNISQVQQSIQKVDEQIEVLSEEKATIANSKEQWTGDLISQKEQLAIKQEQWKNAKQTLDRVTNELEEQQLSKQKLHQQLTWLHDNLHNNGSSEKEMETMYERKAEEKKETIVLIAARRETRAAFTREVEDIELHVKELKRQHRGLAESVKDAEIHCNRLEVELDNRHEKLLTEYDITMDETAELEEISVPIEEARKKVKLLKRSIEELGIVNVGAIEEYERVAERYEFLSTQRADLEEAKQTLTDVMNEMDEEMTRRFTETFKGIQSHFEHVFRALFGGGRAELKLTNPQNMLETGVDIIAQPPGKKLQNLSLLSGGERALTAIALLFSILKIRPVPFCILDEVEAALDEANVQRFSKYLRQFSKETQFIVITHRKGTMEECDVLYGITMQESGVSTLVSVRLEESERWVEPVEVGGK